MGIEPTQNGTSALLTVLKTAEPTRTLPPPRVNIRTVHFTSITLNLEASSLGKFFAENRRPVPTREGLRRFHKCD